MIFTTDKTTVDLSHLQKLYDNNKRNWGIKLSGGADSALVAYMLAKIIKDNNWNDVNLYAITGISNVKPYNGIYAKAIISKIKELLDFDFSGHYTATVSADATISQYIQGQEDLVVSLFKDGTINYRFSGITANPPKTGDSEFLWIGNNAEAAPSDSDVRDRGDNNKAIFGEYGAKPLINTDKRGVASLYELFGITESLFPITRSCEEVTTDFSKHCGRCWFCQERKWGFGKL